MRVMAWNSNWNVSTSTIEEQCDVTAAIHPDLAFFSEWSPLPVRQMGSGERSSNGYLRGPALAERGFRYLAQEHVADHANDGQEWSQKYWGILAASTSPITKVDVDLPTYAPGTWLEAHHEASGVTFVGVRMLAWEQQRLRRDFWEWMLTQFERLATTPAVVLGDFNTELSANAKAKGRGPAVLMHRLTADLGWRDACAAGDPADTHIRNSGKRVRLDYAFASPALRSAISGASPEVLDGRRLLRVPKSKIAPGAPGLSDHAPLIVDLSSVA